MTYADALEVLAAATKFGINPSLDGITSLCEALGRPQDQLACVQVTGTNGKTSTTRFTEALLRAEGAATALFTSPEVERYPERMEVGGSVISDAEFASAVGAAVGAARRVRPDAGGPASGFTEFELLTAAALWLFRERGVDIAVLEVGMGGRWDATSVVSPKVAAITGVGLDHTTILGDTLEAIAAEKAAIIREGSVAVLGAGTEATRRVFVAAAAVAGVPVVIPSLRVMRHPVSPGGTTVLSVTTPNAEYSALEVRAPAYQAANVATAIAAAEAALGRSLAEVHVATALDRVTLPARFELVRSTPPTVVDGSHNPQAAAVLATAIADAWPDKGRRPIVLLGLLADKDAEGIVAALADVAAGFAVTQPISARALPAGDLARIVEAVTGARPRRFDDVPSAVATLMAEASDGLVITGSLTTAGQARVALRVSHNIHRSPTDHAREGIT